MKKKLISLVLIAVMLCSLSGLAYAAHDKDLPVPPAQSVFVPGGVPAQSGPMEGMVPPINALVLCMLEQDLDYDESDDVFVWNSLYYMISLYGQMDSRAELTDDTLTLPGETVADYAAALFTHFDGLPQLPEELKDRVTYDEAQDLYHLARGDAGLSETRLAAAEKMSGGKLDVSGDLVALENERPLCSFRAVLSENNSMFGYSISGLTIL